MVSRSSDLVSVKGSVALAISSGRRNEKIKYG